MKRRLILAIAAVALLAGCATGVKYSDMKQSIPALKAGDGRIYFYRRASMVGAAIQPDIQLNGQRVGESVPGGFFYLDRPAGNYEASSATEIERKLTFTLARGESKYIRTYTTFGVMAGRINFELMSPAEGEADLGSLAHTTK